MPRILPVLLLFLPHSWLHAEGLVNPFARPAQDTTPVQDAQDAPAIIRPELRGVVVAGEHSIANLNGTLLAIGEDASGYELASVTEDAATFRHDGQLVTLELEQPSPEDAP